MGWRIIVKFLDENDNVLAVRDAVDPRAVPWRIPVKSEVMRAEDEHITVEWKKISVLIERV